LNTNGLTNDMRKIDGCRCEVLFVVSRVLQHLIIINESVNMISGFKEIDYILNLMHPPFDINMFVSISGYNSSFNSVVMQFTFVD